MSSSTIEPTVAGRYQIMSRVATGGMGEVYRAHDAVLGREVALKVLHPQFAGDRGFVERFRREARAAAILNHPNIVGVYDWGETNGTYFMVMEFVHGHNLRSLLVEHRRLAPAQVVEISMQVLSALGQAHAHGIVHRDVKPENILIAQDGTVKVADFGLARAFADASVSQTEGTVTGTVQYLAPEQIQGQPADPRTDLYAVGVVLFECLTGRTPFSGETSLAIAYKHVSERVPAPSTLVPSVPPALDAAVLHATARERDRRPGSARELRDEIVRAGVGLPPAPRVADLAAALPVADPTPPERAPTVTIRRPEPPAARRRRRALRGLAALVTVLLLAAAGWAGWRYVIPHYAVVPSVAGLPFGQAQARLAEAGLSSRGGRFVYSTTVAAGQVVRTIPAAGRRIRTTTDVVLVQSKGPPLTTVPYVVGDTQAEAIAAIGRAHLRVAVAHQYDENVTKGMVAGQNPGRDNRIQQGQTVTITVSLGPPLLPIPSVAGEPFKAAAETLRADGFVVGQPSYQYSVTVKAGDVIGTQPPAGKQWPKGATVLVIVSKGPRTFPMPNLLGMTQAQAVAILNQDGLHYTITLVPPGGAPSNTVVGQFPLAGQTVQQGQTVQIIVTQ